MRIQAIFWRRSLNCSLTPCRYPIKCSPEKSNKEFSERKHNETKTFIIIIAVVVVVILIFGMAVAIKKMQREVEQSDNEMYSVSDTTRTIGGTLPVRPAIIADHVIPDMIEPCDVSTEYKE